MIRRYETLHATGPKAAEKRKQMRHERVFPPPSERYDISDLVERITSKGLPRPPEHLETKALHALVSPQERGRRIGGSEAEVLWDELKEERNALVAIVLEKFWKHFLRRATAKLNRHVAQHTIAAYAFLSAPNLSALFEQMLARYISDEQEKNIQGQKKSMKQFLNRLEAITNFGFIYKRWTGGPGKVQHFILRGFNTGKAMMHALMMIGVTQFLARDIPCTKENLEKYIRANMRHITMPASANLEHGPFMVGIFDREASALMKSLGCDAQSPTEGVPIPSSALQSFSFNEDTFELTPYLELYAHVVDDHSYLGVPPAIGDALPRGKTTGCPARYVRFLFKQLGDMYVATTARLLAKNFQSDRMKIISLRTMFEGL